MYEGLQRHHFVKLKKKRKLNSFSYISATELFWIYFFLVSILYAKDNATDLVSTGPGLHFSISNRGDKLMLFCLPSLLQAPLESVA